MLSPEERLSSLTPREREVLALIADLHTDRDIAEILVISPHTVHRHVSSIIRKLDVASRREAGRAYLAHCASGAPPPPLAEMADSSGYESPRLPSTLAPEPSVVPPPEPTGAPPDSWGTRWAWAAAVTLGILAIAVGWALLTLRGADGTTLHVAHAGLSPNDVLRAKAIAMEIERVVELDMTDEQSAAMVDGFISYDELEAATARMAECVTAYGISAEVLPGERSIPSRMRFIVDGSNREAEHIADCRVRHWRATNWIWDLQLRVDWHLLNAAYDEIERCLGPHSTSGGSVEISGDYVGAPDRRLGVEQASVGAAEACADAIRARTGLAGLAIRSW